jgi:hypothetical protein
MKAILSTKTVLGITCSAAISGAMLAGMYEETKAVPAHWYIEPVSADRAVDVQLIAAPAASGICEWVTPDSRGSLARCPQLQVSAKKVHARVRLAESDDRKRVLP